MGLQTQQERYGQNAGGDAAVARLRDALRAGGSSARAVSEAVRPLIERLNSLFLGYCETLAASTRGPFPAEGADLAQDAWAKALRYLAGPIGDRVRTEEHLMRLLRVTAKTRFLDLLEQAQARRAVPLDASGEDEAGEAGDSLGERIAAPEALPPVLQFAAGGAYQRLVEALFRDEGRFKRIARQPPRRRLKQYQAYVLCQLGAFLWREARRDADAVGPALDPEFTGFVREYAYSLGVPDDAWEAVESAAGAEPPLPHGEEPKDIPPAVLKAVNELCGVNLHEGNLLSVLRYEMNAFAGRGDSEGGKAANESGKRPKGRRAKGVNANRSHEESVNDAT